MFWFLGI